jgi:GNAT superfamily N-acetyltransferase
LPAEGITLRPVQRADEPFLYQVYASTRLEEMAITDWPPDRQDAFLRQQFQAQQAHYSRHFPNSEHNIILLDGRPIGRFFVSRNSSAIHLVDISLLPKHRAAGIGTGLIKELLDEGRKAGIPVRLHVFRMNRAQHLYTRLGFKRIGDTPTHIEMEAAPQNTKA